MAIIGKFEMTRSFFCARCGTVQTVRARSLDWTGDSRKKLVCPGCKNVIEAGPNPKTNGNVSSCRPVELVMLPDGDRVVLEDYECSEAEAWHFTELFREVVKRIPRSAADAILAHWQTGGGSPHVWLLENRNEWKGSGWAASSGDGLSLYAVSTLVGRIPDEHMMTAIAHEFGHVLFVAGSEPNHAKAATTRESIVNPAARDPLRKLRQEWLVWRLMESWNFDQLAMEEWMERNMIDDATGIRPQESPQLDAEFEGKCIAGRKSKEERLNDMVFPYDFEKYRSA